MSHLQDVFAYAFFCMQILEEFTWAAQAGNIIEIDIWYNIGEHLIGQRDQTFHFGNIEDFGRVE